MKKILSLLLALAMLFSFAACGNNDDSEPIDSGNTESANEESENVEPVNTNAVNLLTGIQDLDPEMEGFRIVGFSVGNTMDALPQSSLSLADMLLEIEVEYGITRTMAFFSDYRQINKIGSIRSLRTQFLWIASSLDAMIVHAGCASYMYTELDRMGYSTLNGAGYGEDLDSLYREQSRLDAGYAWEHTAYSNPARVKVAYEDLYKMDTTSSLTEPVFNFSDTVKIPTTGSAQSAYFQFSDWFDSSIEYDESKDKYLLSQHGEARVDAENNEQFAFNNVFIIVAVRDGWIEGTSSPHYDYSQGGTAYYLSKGYYEKCTWTKNSEWDFFTFYTEDGKELEVNPGTSYMAVVNTDNAWSINIQ